MSVIFDALLVLGMSDDEAVRELNTRLYALDETRHQQFKALDTNMAGGSKVFTTDVYAAAFNHFIPSDVEGCIAATSWRYPFWVLYVRDLGDYSMGADESDDLRAWNVAHLRERIADQP